MEETCLSGYQQASATVHVLDCKSGRINSGRKSVVHVISAMALIRSLPLDPRSQASGATITRMRKQWKPGALLTPFAPGNEARVNPVHTGLFMHMDLWVWSKETHV